MRRQLRSNAVPDVMDTVKYAVAHVPYYKEYGRYLSSGAGLNALPVIRKSDISGREKSLVSDRCNIRRLKRIETGGSTGFSLELYRSIRDIINGMAMADNAFDSIGSDLRIAVLRGQKPEHGICEKINGNTIVLSSYALSVDTVDEYIDCLRRYRISCLHVYPSSIVILARLIKQKYGVADLPMLKGIFSSSEIFSRENKSLVKEVFPNVKIVDYYGHNEQSCCAVAVDDGYFDFNFNCGYVEFLETGETINGNRIAEIVSTSVMNRTMPFIRYGTDDYVELDKEGNVVSIIGRTSDFVVNERRQLVPCIILTRDESMLNVISFQYRQHEIGKLDFCVVTNDRFGERDRRSLLEDLEKSFNGQMKCAVVKVESIARTKIGKQKRLIQDLNIKEYQ